MWLPAGWLQCPPVMIHDSWPQEANSIYLDLSPMKDISAQVLH